MLRLSSGKAFTASTVITEACIIKNPDAMYKRILLILCFSFSFQLFAQEIKIKADILFDEFSTNLLKTSDVLYIGDNSDKYLMSKSPLSHFDGYRSIYSDTVIIYGNSFKLPFNATENGKKKYEITRVITHSDTFLPFGLPFGSAGNSEKEYMATWLLLNTQLYLCRVHFPFEGKREDKFVYRPMEKFTGKRFNRKNIPDIGIGEWIYGLMPATWFTDTLYVKKANSEKEPLPREVWQEKHYLRMIFNKGKLVSTEVVANNTWIETLTWPRSGKVHR